MDMYRAYVSYSRVKGSNGESLPENDCLPTFVSNIAGPYRDSQFEILVDLIEVEGSEPIGGFISELTNNSGLIILLSRRYFESIWCMREIRAFFERRDFHLHSYVVWEADKCELETCSSDCCDYKKDISSILKSQKDSAKLFWEEYAGEYSDDAKENLNALDDIFKQLSELNIRKSGDFCFESKKPPCSHIDEMWEKLRDKIDRAKRTSSLSIRGKTEDEFETLCKNAFNNALSSSKFAQLSEEIIAAARLSDSDAMPAGATPADAVWTYAAQLDNEPISRLTLFYRAAKELLDTCPDEQKEGLKTGVKKALGVLLVSLLDHSAYKDRAFPLRRNLLDIPCINFKENSMLVAECFFAAIEPSGHCRANLEMYQNELKVHNARSIKIGNREPSPDDTAISLQLAIRDAVAPQLAKGVQKLANDDLTDLDHQLKLRFERGTGCYLLLVEDKKEFDENVLLKLTSVLPWLFIFRIKPTDSCSPAIVTTEFTFESELTHFGKLFH